MPRRLRLVDQLFIPFGRPKWKIKEINIVKVSPDGTYIESNTPFVHIDKKENRPLQIADFWEVIPDQLFESLVSISPHFDRFDRDKSSDISQKALTEFEHRYEMIRDYLKNRCETGSIYEKKFLDIYFDYWRECASEEGADIMYVSNCLRPLLPLPQAHLYLEDDLDERTYMQKVDFAFWTGNQMIALEIDSDTKLLPEIVRRDRRYRNSGVEVVHILNSEIEEFMSSVMNLLPKELKSIEFLVQLPYRSPYIQNFDVDRY
ncbi:MAG: hypothetical protein U7127_19480 [Phormidium sp.]